MLSSGRLHQRCGVRALQQRSFLSRTPALKVQMVEGHQCHRVAAAHRKLLLNKPLDAASPNGRFVEGAAAIHQRPLRRIEVHGKNLFYFFSHSPAVAGMKLLGGTSAPTPLHTVAHASVKSEPGTAALPLPTNLEEDVGIPVDEDTVLQGGIASGAAASGSDVAAATTTSATPGKALAAGTATGLALPAAPVKKRAASRGRNARVSKAGSGSAQLDEGGQADDKKDGKAPAGSAVSAASTKKRRGGKAGKVEELPEIKVEESDHDRVVVVRIHFGMSGAFRLNTLPGPEPTATTRLALSNTELGVVGHVSAMSLEHGGLDLYRSCASKLGPDPLREDADKEVLWESVQRSKKPIGLVLMSQELVAGIGNIYRAEILYKAGVHPEQPSFTVTKDQFDRLWYHSVDLLQRGFVMGSILTVDPEDAIKLGKPWTRRYIYNQNRCGRCKGVVRSWDMATRTVYCCETCQPLINVDRKDAAAQIKPEDDDVDVDVASTKAKRTVVKRRKPAAASTKTAAQQKDEGAAADDVVVVDEGENKSAQPGDEDDDVEFTITTKGGRSKRGKAGKTSATGRQQQQATADEEALPGSDMLSAARRKAMANAKPAKVFVSHCAPDSEDELHAKGLAPSKAGKSATDIAVGTKATGSIPNSALLMMPEKMTVAQLKATLLSLSMSNRGKKADLVERLKTVLPAIDTTSVLNANDQPEQPQAQDQTEVVIPTPAAMITTPSTAPVAQSQPEPQLQTTAPQASQPHAMVVDLVSEDELDQAEAALANALGVPPLLQPRLPQSRQHPGNARAHGSVQALPEVVPGIAALVDVMATAKEAALEKVMAGENRAVEHVALADDDTDALIAALGGSGSRKKRRAE